MLIGHLVFYFTTNKYHQCPCIMVSVCLSSNMLKHDEIMSCVITSDGSKGAPQDTKCSQIMPFLAKSYVGAPSCQESTPDSRCPETSKQTNVTRTLCVYILNPVLFCTVGVAEDRGHPTGLQGW